MTCFVKYAWLAMPAPSVLSGYLIFFFILTYGFKIARHILIKYVHAVATIFLFHFGLVGLAEAWRRPLSVSVN